MPNGLNIMPSFNTLTPGAKASVDLPLGLTYERLMLYANVDSSPARDLPTADFGTYFGELRLLVDGKAEIRIDVADLVSLNAFYGRTAENGWMGLYLSPPEMRTPEGEDFFGYGTANRSVQTLQFEIELASGQTFNTVELYALQSPGRPFGAHYAIDRYNVQPSATGKKQVQVARGDYALKGLHLASAAVNSVLVEANQRRLRDTRRSGLNFVAEDAGRSPQAGFTHIDMMDRNRLSEALLMDLADFRLEYDFSATGAFDLYVEKAVGSPA